MSGVEGFVSQNFGEHDSSFYSCLHLIVYSYSLLEKSKRYSRIDIRNLATSIRGKTDKNVELEDFLRNDLVKNYIEPNRQLFGLDNYLFQSGAEEFSNNIKTGILDIKVCSPLFNGNTYYIFECKRLNKSIIDKYVKEGICRFIKGQYYPNSENSVSGMISFLESVDTKNAITSESAFHAIESVLLKYKNETQFGGCLYQCQLDCCKYKYVDDFKYAFQSKHLRSSSSLPIDIFHIILDYNHLIKD